MDSGAAVNHDSDVTVLLDRQELRRLQGIPTLTVIIGPVGLGIHAWKQWNRSRPVAIIPAEANPGQVATTWMSAVLRGEHLRAAAVNWFAELAGLSQADAESRWLNGTAHDLDRVLD